MTARHHRRVSQFFAPRMQRTDARYSLHVLDGSREEYAIERRQSHREAQADDPWLSPAKSETVRALLILILGAQAHGDMVEQPTNGDLDLRDFCEDAKLSPRQTEVICLAGEGWHVMEIAEWLGISHPTVIQHLRYGRHKLAGRLPLDVVSLPSAIPNI